MPKLNTREYRDCTITIQNEASDRDAFLVRGYAFKWAPYPLYEDERGNTVYEEFKREAFENTDMSDIIMQLNHQGTVMARLRNNTLKLTLDDIGGFIEADLSKSQDARNLYAAIDNGLIDRMSWGFIPGDYHFDRGKECCKAISLSFLSCPCAVKIRIDCFGTVLINSSYVLFG